MIMNITQQDYITQGSQRVLYAHPQNKDWCLKIPKEDSNQRFVKREISYTNKYKDKINCIPLYHGTVETNLGTGYIFDLVTNHDGSTADNLQKVTDEGMESKEDSNKLEQKIQQLYALLLEQHIIVSDLHPGNILVRKTSASDYDLWIVDGLGNSDFIKICDVSKIFLKKKLIRKFFRLTQALNLNTSFS